MFMHMCTRPCKNMNTNPTTYMHTLDTPNSWRVQTSQSSALSSIACADMAEQQSAAWVQSIIPLSINPSKILPDDGYFQDYYQLQESLVTEELAPFDAEVAAFESSEVSMPAKLLRSMHSSSLLCQTLSDLIQVNYSSPVSSYVLLPLQDEPRSATRCT
jgi:hypothetical protein